ELGATVCTPRTPRCAKCPLRRLCVAHERGREEAYPEPRARTALKTVDLWAIVRMRRSDGAVLLRRRTAQGVNAGQWEVPLKQPAKVPPRDARWMGKVRHGILATNFRVDVFLADSPARAAKAPDRWVMPDELEELHVTTLTRKLLHRVELESMA